jgi:hypothetical protein
VIARHIAIVVALIATVSVGGCKGIPQDDRYQTHDGGRSNSRAAAPDAGAATRPS